MEWWVLFLCVWCGWDIGFIVDLVGIFIIWVMYLNIGDECVCFYNLKYIDSFGFMYCVVFVVYGDIFYEVCWVFYLVY